MKARDYLEHVYLPWVITLEKYNTINRFKSDKEAFLCESYNYITKQFKEIMHYELYMFRFSSQKIVMGNLNYEMLIVKTPEQYAQNDACYIIIIYNDEECYYYTVDWVIESKYEIKKYVDKKPEIIGITTNDIKEITGIIKKNLLLM